MNDRGGNISGAFRNRSAHWRWVVVRSSVCWLALCVGIALVVTGADKSKPLMWIGIVLLVAAVGGLVLTMQVGSRRERAAKGLSDPD
jgi:Zn-dependent membrane protease YugP